MQAWCGVVVWSTDLIKYSLQDGFSMLLFWLLPYYTPQLTPAH